MNPKINPYAPGAGTIPPQLAGRDEIINKADIALDRCKNAFTVPLFDEFMKRVLPNHF